MTAKKNNIPALRFPGFKDEWHKKKLIDLSTLITKGTTPSKFVKTGIKFIKIECFKEDGIDVNKCLFIDEITHNKELKRSILNEGDLLFAIAGATIGKCNIVPKEILPANTNQALAIIRLIKSENKVFVYHNLKSELMQKYIKDNISVGAQPNLNLEQMGNFSFYLPTPPEQQKIADFLTAVDKRIEQLTLKKQLLEQYKKGVMQKLFSQQLRFKDDNGKDFPDWEEKELGELASIYSGYSPSNYTFNVRGEYPYLKVEDLNNTSKYQRLSRLNCIESKDVIEKHSVIFPKRGAAIMTNKVRINTTPVILDTNLMALKPIPKLLHYEFLYYFLTFSKLFKIADTSSIPQINNKHILPYKILLPHVKEQRKFASFLASIDLKIDTLQLLLKESLVYKSGLLQQMFV